MNKTQNFGIIFNFNISRDDNDFESQNSTWSVVHCMDSVQNRESVSRVPHLITCRDLPARDEPTRTCCGPLPSWVPKIKILEKIKNIDFNFENQDITIYILKI